MGKDYSLKCENYLHLQIRNLFLPAKDLRYLTKYKQRKVIQLCDISDKGEILDKKQMKSKLDVPLRWLVSILSTYLFHKINKSSKCL